MSSTKTKKTAAPKARAKTFRTTAITNVVIALAAIVLLNFAVSGIGGSIDLTANKRFSVNPATVAILQSGKAPLTIKYYLSEVRPADLAELQSEMVGRLEAIAAAAGPDAMRFEASRDFEAIGDTAAWLKEHVDLGVREVRMQTPSGTLSFVSSLEISHPSLRRPLQISVTRADAMEYRLALAAVQLRDVPLVPVGVDAQIAALTSKFHITYYSSGADTPTPPLKTSPLPKEVGSLRADVSALLELMAKSANGNLSYEIVDDFNRSDLRRPEDMSRVASSAQAGQLIGYYSTIIVDDGKNAPHRLQRIEDASRMPKRIMDAIWELMQPRKRIGIYLPRQRPEYGNAEAALYSFNLDEPLTAERRIATYLGSSLGYQVVSVAAGSNLAAQEIAALVLVRPSELSQRDLYDISAYLAGGGSVLLFHGTWHLGLYDSALEATEVEGSKQVHWVGREASGEIVAKRLKRTLEGYLKSLGVSSDGTLLIASSGDSLSAEVLIPPAPRQENRSLPPSPTPVLPPLAPFARGESGGHLLATQVPVLPLKAGARFIVDEDEATRRGLRIEPLFYAPKTAKVIRADASLEKLRFLYAPSQEGSLASYWPDASKIEDAGGAPVALLIEGSFPFDASIAPPRKGPEDKSVYQPPGADFTKNAGRLVVVGSPDLFEPLESGMKFPAPWGVAMPTLLGGRDNDREILETSRQRLLSNIVDTMVYGSELLGVRQSLAPTPRRLEAWSAQEKLVWTLLVVGLIPALVAMAGIGVALRRRARRRHYEIAHKTLGREDESKDASAAAKKEA